MDEFMTGEVVYQDDYVPDFDVIAEREDWDHFTMLCVCRDFIASNKLSEELGHFAAEYAEEHE